MPLISEANEKISSVIVWGLSGMVDKELLSELKDSYLGELKTRGTIRSRPVERAFRKVNRHQFLQEHFEPHKQGNYKYAGKRYQRKHLDPSEEEDLAQVYSDRAFLTKISPPSSSSQPSLVADMIEQLEIREGMNILEIGTGSGYNTALLQEVVGESGKVTTLDIQQEVTNQAASLLNEVGYENPTVICEDGAKGFPPNSPYERIIAAIGCTDISPQWMDQLSEAGLMLIPLQHGCEGNDPRVQLKKERGKLVGRFVGWSGFMTIQGKLQRDQQISFEEVAQLAEEEPRETKKFEKIGDEEAIAFSLFAALNDKRHFVRTYGIRPGLKDGEDGAVALGEGELYLYGEDPPIEDFESLFNRWKEAGRPSLAKYSIKLYPKGHNPPVNKQEWLIRRGHFDQKISLSNLQ